MGSNDEFGPDTETIRAWLSKRATYAKDARVIETPRGGPVASDPSPSPAGPDSTTVGRSVVDALRAPEPVAPEAAPTLPMPRAQPAPPGQPAPAPVQVRVGRWTEPEENLNSLQASTDVDFPARGGARRTMTLLLLAAVGATAASGYVATQDRTAGTIGIAAVLGFLTLMIWAVRAGCTTTELSIRRGQLIIRRAGHTEVVDIASHHTPIAIVGEPGHRRWTVLVERTGLPLVVINASMVEAHWFTSALYRLRPELRPGHSPRTSGEAEYLHTTINAGS